MGFTLLFTIGLSVILLLGAFFICKSDLPTNDKIVSIIAILSLFCLVSIVNEAKKGSPQEIKFNIGDLKKSFSALPEPISGFDYALPMVEVAREFVTKSLGGWNPEVSKAYQYGFVQTEPRGGKTLGFKEYTRDLHSRGVPALYIDIKDSNTGIQQFLEQLKIPSLNVLDDIVEKLNKDGKVPNIFVDNIQNAFTAENKLTNDLQCSVCEYFKSLFDNKHVNVILISSHPLTRDHLRSIESYNRRVSFFETPEGTFYDIDNSVLEKVNQNIRKEEKKLNNESSQVFFRMLGWNFQALAEYVNVDSYDNIKSFIDAYIQTQTKKISSESGLTDLVKALVSLVYEKNENSWISYGVIKKRYDGNPLEKLEEAVKANILIKKGNMYKFKNQAIYYAALLSQGFKFPE